MEKFMHLDAVALPIAQSNFDTDQILPARYLQKPRSDDFGTYLFRDLRYRADGEEDERFVLNAPAYRPASIVVANENFACGSSREHAVWALYDGGFRAVIAASFGDIFRSNALKNGLLPVSLPAPAVQRLLAELQAAPGAHIQVDLRAQTVTGPAGDVEPFAIEPFPRHCLLEGLEEIDYTLTQRGAIDAFEQARARETAHP
jgi:3-isopropylmalate/(R)-2-methylmalate dehydratase small subunit